jgi:hypothetical protein
MVKGHAYCRVCNNAYSKKYYYADREGRLAKIAEYVRKLRLRRKALINDLKSRPCVDCGRTFPAVCMDFDHLDGTNKQGCVSSMVNNTGASLKRVMAEIAKCDLVCANCHRIRTHHRTVAQQVEHALDKRKVVGSRPTRTTKIR